MSKEHANVSEPIACGSTAPSAPGSPNNRIKFLCSNGGKILPSPVDGHLKYVGGETRLISVSRDINFQELMKKLTYQIDDEMVLKYQLVFEELDSLVSVKSDDDLRHMFEEYDRYESTGAPRLRVFLFPAKSVVVDSGSMELHALEQRYIDAVNGIVRAPTTGTKRHPTINASLGSFGVYSASACSSPRSPESCNTDAVNQETVLPNNYQNGRTKMHKVQSSPSICSLDGQRQGSPNTYSYLHHYHQTYRQPLYPSYQFSKPLVDHPQRGGAPERLISVRSVGRADGVKYQVDPVSQYYYPAARHSRGS